MLQIIMGYPAEANTQPTHLNVHGTSDSQYPVHLYISPSSVYGNHASISSDLSHHYILNCNPDYHVQCLAFEL